MKQKEIDVRYEIKINTDLNNQMNLSIYIKDSKLFFICYFYKNYFKKTFSNSYSLDDLKKSSSYFKQFNSEYEILNEIINNKYKGKENIQGNEETSNIIKLVIPLPGAQFSSMSFELKEIIKKPEEIVNEYKNIVKQYENKFKFEEFNSKILTGKELEKETLKMWISPRKKLTTKLLYSYHDIPYKMNFDFFSHHVYYSNNEFNETVSNFHEKCDGKKNILIICKSNNEIFGGYTPLSFNSSDEYGNDNDSFLFSLNRLEKYPKDSHEETRSIWCYKDYGPSFHYDLYFRQGKMNVVKYEKNNYLIYKRWINEDNCYTNDKGILLDSLEVFQVIGENNFYEPGDIGAIGAFWINNHPEIAGNIIAQGINYGMKFESQKKIVNEKKNNSFIKNDDKTKHKVEKEKKENKEEKENQKEKKKEGAKN